MDNYHSVDIDNDLDFKFCKLLLDETIRIIPRLY